MLQNVGLADSHTHSRCSFDGSEPVRALGEAAERKGLRCLTVTDHYDCNCFDLPILLGTALASSQETAECAQAMQGRLTVLFGAELGQPIQAPAAAEAVLAAAEYDFILGSLHNVAGYPDFYDIDYAAYDCKVLFTRYFAELREMIRWGGFDALAHLTYPLRYLKAGVEEVWRSCFLDEAEQVLLALAQAGKGLEINTSNFRQINGGPGMELQLVRRFRELGGTVVTLGSDAHTAGAVGGGIREGASIAAQAGFTQIAVFRNRKPEFIPINDG